MLGGEQIEGIAEGLAWAELKESRVGRKLAISIIITRLQGQLEGCYLMFPP
jgi:hypothetical protein